MQNMSIGARPLDERGVTAIFEKKMADFHHKARELVLRHLDLELYCDAAFDDPDVRLELETGLIDHIQDPVIVRLSDQELYTCPRLAAQLLAKEPPEIHRAFVEGVFLRKLFRFFVPAAHEGGENWEVTHQVR